MLPNEAYVLFEKCRHRKDEADWDHLNVYFQFKWHFLWFRKTWSKFEGKKLKTNNRTTCILLRTFCLPHHHIQNSHHREVIAGRRLVNAVAFCCVYGHHIAELSTRSIGCVYVWYISSLHCCCLSLGLGARRILLATIHTNNNLSIYVIVCIGDSASGYTKLHSSECFFFKLLRHRRNSVDF